MSKWLEAQQGGFVYLSDEALPSVSSSTALFANAPANTRKIVLTIRVATLSLRFSGKATTANGHDFAVGTHDLLMNQGAAQACRAIESGGTTTGFITYFGVK